MLGGLKENIMEKFLYNNIIKIAIVISLPLWMAFAFADDKQEGIIGHSFDGHAIHKSDTEIDGIRVDNIRGSSYDKENNTLNLRLKKKNVEVHFYNNCFELGFANNLGFRSDSSLSKYNVILRKGDAFIPISFGQVGMPCRIKAIYEVPEEAENVEEN
jgi:hypothetical protein